VESKENKASLKILIRYGKIIFTKDTVQALGLTDGSYVRLGVDDNFANCYLNVSQKDDKSNCQIRKSGDYYYLPCTDILKFFNLYSSIPSIYELINEKDDSDKDTFRISKIVDTKDPKFNEVFNDRKELRAIIAMINAHI